jgi:hypothetical protein
VSAPVDERISIRAHYERFPATIKGAFVLRAAERDPHQVRIEAARVVELSGAGSRSIDLQPATLDVAPNLDLFVPFEFSITELSAGWYRLACDVLVDGVPAQIRAGAPFPIAWPRATVRRGTVAVGKAVALGKDKARIEQVECGGDSIKVVYAAETPITVKLTADGAALSLIEDEFDEAASRGKIVAYPVMKTQARLEIQIKGAEVPVSVKLP